MDSSKLTYFISDLHLGARYFLDPKEQERKVCAWLRKIAPDAGRIYLVGDVLDYWYEYKHVVPRGFVRFLGTLAELADSGIEITWLIGNHDIWIFDYLPAELGIRVIDGVLREKINGKDFVIAHGDGLGPVPMAERLMRATFRSKFLQKCFAAIHPRWTVGFAYWWSSKNRLRHHLSPTSEAPDPKPLIQWAETVNPKPDYFVCGHYHMLLDKKIGHAHLIILGDWITNMSYAVFDGQTLTLHKESPAKLDGGLALKSE